MASIDDILAASDSDDEFDTAAPHAVGAPGGRRRVQSAEINLESLLEDDDDDDDEEAAKDVKPLHAPTPPSASSTVPLPSRSLLLESLTSPEGMPRLPFSQSRFSSSSTSSSLYSAIPLPTLTLQLTPAQPPDAPNQNPNPNPLRSLQNLTLTLAQPLHPSPLGGAELEFLGSLDAAEQREQRNLTTGREVISALQTKRAQGSSSSGSGSSGSGPSRASGSSSIKYSDMEILSTQLRRNASYKQVCHFMLILACR